MLLGCLTSKNRLGLDAVATTSRQMLARDPQVPGIHRVFHLINRSVQVVRAWISCVLPAGGQDAAPPRIIGDDPCAWVTSDSLRCQLNFSIFTTFASNLEPKVSPPTGPSFSHRFSPAKSQVRDHHPRDLEAPALPAAERGAHRSVGEPDPMT